MSVVRIFALAFSMQLFIFNADQMYIGHIRINNLICRLYLSHISAYYKLFP